ncbi:ATP-binding protein [Maribacter sp. 2308TA10-17]|uniref:PAS domain-containing sensor histidine kinase n=1 Tax=Maribacter sp. 2308TA10-17 TaxID=3386276 RepID=UPI0039BD7FFD
MHNISFTHLIEDSPTAIASFDTDLKLVLHSHFWYSTFQLPQHNLKGKKISAMLTKAGSELDKIFMATLNGLSHRIREQKIILNDSSVKWFDLRTLPIKNDEGLIVGLLVSANDVTERKRENDLLKMTKQVSLTGGWEVNLITKAFYWTSVTRSIYEVSDDFIPDINTAASEFFKEGISRESLIRARQAAIEKGTPFDIEAELITPAGNAKWVRIKGEPEFKNGTCSRIFGAIQDINQYKIAELQYHQEAERLKQATQASEVGTWQLSLPSRIAVWDDTCFKLHNIDKTTCASIYDSWVLALPPEVLQNVITEVYSKYTQKEKTSIEYQVVNPDKTLRDIRAIVTFLKIENNFEAQAIGIVMDVTKEKEAERKLQEFARIRKQQNEHLTSFAHMVSHDLRAHSTNLSMVANFLVEEQDNEEKLKLMQMLKNATDSLVNTVSNLNTVVQSSTELPGQITQLNLLDAILRTQSNISSLLLEKEVKCLVDVSKNHTVKALPAYLDSILLNLFTNSIKYASPERKPLIKISSKIRRSCLELSFVDNGKGINLKKHSKSIFGMHKTFHRNKDAMGVGLYLTKNQIESIGGKISVESEVSVGTTFTLEFQTN